MTAEAVFSATIDPVRNLARVRFAGDFTGPAMGPAVTKVQKLLPALKPGFTVFADFGQVTSMDLDCVQPLTRIMDLCRAAGIGMIVRILPPSDRDIGIKLLGIVHYRGKVKTMTVDNLEEAERALS